MSLTQLGYAWMANFFAENEFSQLRRTIFAETPKLSTYLWTLNVGYYIVKECEDYRIPMRIIVRKGQHQPESINYCFSLIKKTVDFYEHIFGQPYPFSKLDFVCCPMVRYSAMESAGCIVCGESMMATKRMENLSSGSIMNSTLLIMHEISH